MSKIMIERKNTSLIWKKCIIWNFVYTALNYLLFAFTQSKTHNQWKEFIYPFVINLLITAIFSFSIFYLMIAYLGNYLDKKEKFFHNSEKLSSKERTILFVNISNFPTKIFTGSFIYYFLQSIIFLFLIQEFFYKNLLIENLSTIIFTFIYTSYICALINYVLTESYYAKVNSELFANGIEKSFIYRKKSVGIPFSVKCIMFIALPIIFATIYTFCIFSNFLDFYGSVNNLIDAREKILIANIFNCAVILLCARIYYKQYKSNISTFQNIATNFLEEKNESIKTKISLNNKIQYNIYILEEIIKQYSALISKVQKTGFSIFESTTSLAAISNQLSNNSKMQSGFVNGFKNTMKDAYELSKNITNLTAEVSKGTISTQENVLKTYEILQKNIKQMNSIKESNQLIIDEISRFMEQMKSVDEIASLIYNIAEQTKNVALNTTLEAISSSQTEKNSENFNIVSIEINRLSNSTAESIRQIHFYIDDIQKISRLMLESSDKTTINIQEEAEFIDELENQYNSIKSSSEDIAKKANDISNTVEEQTISFRQIVGTLDQIGESIENFSQSAQTIKTNIEEINNVAKNLT